LYGPSGSFVSPNYPNEYVNNMDCTWHIVLDDGDVHLTFSDFITESCCDHVYVYDGPSTTSRLIGRYQKYLFIVLFLGEKATL